MGVVEQLLQLHFALDACPGICRVHFGLVDHFDGYFLGRESVFGHCLEVTFDAPVGSCAYCFSNCVMRNVGHVNREVFRCK